MWPIILSLNHPPTPFREPAKKEIIYDLINGKYSQSLYVNEAGWFILIKDSGDLTSSARPDSLLQFVCVLQSPRRGVYVKRGTGRASLSVGRLFQFALDRFGFVSCSICYWKTSFHSGSRDCCVFPPALCWKLVSFLPSAAIHHSDWQQSADTRVRTHTHEHTRTRVLREKGVVIFTGFLHIYFEVFCSVSLCPSTYLLCLCSAKQKNLLPSTPPLVSWVYLISVSPLEACQRRTGQSERRGQCSVPVVSS